MKSSSNTNEMICPYCNLNAVWVENKEIYGRNYGKSYMIWLCRLCEAYVGCHKNTKKPLGTMANASLRKMRIHIHSLIDPIWKSGIMSRKDLYKKLSDYMGKEFHVGECNENDCKKIEAYIHKEFINEGAI
jgi:hypothetical protein